MRASLRRPPLLAFLALTAGLAGALVLLALLDAAIFRPIPGVRDPERLVSIESPTLPYPSFVEFQTAAASAGSHLEGVAAFSHRHFSFSAGAGADERRTGVVVAGDYFGLLGVRPAVGRLLTGADDRTGAPLAVVLASAFWRERFAGAPDIVGREVRLNASAFQVVGVADSSFRGLTRERRPDFWVTAHAWIENAPSTFAGRSLDQRGWGWLRTFGRLAPYGEPEGARARLAAEAERQRSAYPSDLGDDFGRVELKRTTLDAAGIGSEGAARAISAALLALVGLLVVLAVSSAAHLFLARGEARRQELATRLALGADRTRIVLLLLVEPIASALTAALAALLVARSVLALVARETLPGGVAIGELGLAIDPALAVAGSLLALVAGAAAGWIPARGIWRDDLGRSLGSARTVSSGSARARRALTVAQVAISLLLVAATALFSRALLRATAIDTGYSGERLGFVTLDAGLGRLTPDQAAVAYDAAVAAVASLPGVEGASLVGALPLDPGTDTESISVPGYTPGEKERVFTEFSSIGPGALTILGVELVAGREFDGSDEAGRDLVAVVSKRFADRYFSGREPLGATVRLSSRTVRIVGVAADVRAHGPGEIQEPAIYLALRQNRGPSSLWPVSIAFRAGRDPQAILPAVVRATATAAPGVPVVPVGSFDQILASALAAQRFAAGLLGLFSLVATLLAALGLFGVVAHAAAARTRELGLRAALGAAPSSLVRLLVGAAIPPVVVGGALGVAAALPVAFLARGLVVGLEQLDLAAVALAGIVLLLAAALAAIVPAVRGARLDPVAALRTE